MGDLALVSRQVEEAGCVFHRLVLVIVAQEFRNGGVS